MRRFKTRQNPKGTKTNPKGTKTNPEGTKVNLEGTKTNPEITLAVCIQTRPEAGNCFQCIAVKSAQHQRLGLDGVRINKLSHKGQNKVCPLAIAASGKSLGGLFKGHRVRDKVPDIFPAAKNKIFCHAEYYGRFAVYMLESK